jgi:hypothetical protein
MNKKVLFYALAINIVTSFLGALVYKYFCDTKQLFCGDTNQNPLAIYIPLVISGAFFIVTAFFLSGWTKKWVKLPILFFIIPVILAAMFNSEGGGFNINTRMLIVGIPPVLIATIAAWFYNCSRAPRVKTRGSS